MHPIELMRKYDWSYHQLALEFGVSEAEARRWGFRKTASNYRNPPSMAYKLADRIDKELSKARGLIEIHKKDDPIAMPI